MIEAVCVKNASHQNGEVDGGKENDENINLWMRKLAGRLIYGTDALSINFLSVKPKHLFHAADDEENR
jgi:hypothetical protein